METDFIKIASHTAKEYLDSNLFGPALETLNNFPCRTRWCPISTPALSLPTPYLSHSSSSHLAPQVLPKSHTSGNHGTLNMKSARKRLRSLLNNSDAAEDLGRYSYWSNEAEKEESEKVSPTCCGNKSSVEGECLTGSQAELWRLVVVVVASSSRWRQQC